MRPTSGPEGSIRIEPLTGEALTRALPDLARLRIAVFREWPYLYDGTITYEQRYLDKFSKEARAVIVAAFDGDTIIGVATASPMSGYASAFAEPLIARGFDISRVFYFSESVLLPAYRGRGIGHAFFDHREAHARSFGLYTHAAFCAVMRPADHPMRPKDYVPLDAFWRKRGFAPLEGVIATFDWKDVGEAGETSKPMQFWGKAL